MTGNGLVQGVIATAKEWEVPMNSTQAQLIIARLIREFSQLREGKRIPCQSDGTTFPTPEAYATAVVAKAGSVHVLDQEALQQASRYSGPNGAVVEKKDHIHPYDSPVLTRALGLS